MAGEGERFRKAGYAQPKPLIKINQVPMVELVVTNLSIPAKHIFICRKEHYQDYNLGNLLNKIKPNSKIITVEKATDGPASSVLLAKKYIDNDEELFIVDSDHLTDLNLESFISRVKQKKADGAIVVFNANEKKWSFVKINNEGFIEKVVEKEPISNFAVAGIYYFKKGKYFVDAAEKMIMGNLRVNNEFYVGPVYNELIKDGKKILPYEVIKTHALGTPEDLKKYINEI